MAEESVQQADVEGMFRSMVAVGIERATRDVENGQAAHLAAIMDLLRCSREGQDDARILALEARVDELTEKVKRLLSATAHSVMDRPDRPGALGRKLG